jgi:hypothetical protein
VFGLVGEDGRGRIWPEDVPLEVAAQMQQQVGKEAEKQTAKAQRQQARGKLQAIPSPAAAKAEPASSPEEPSEQEPSPNAHPSSPPGTSRKRELPSYLRVVK